MTAPEHSVGFLSWERLLTLGEATGESTVQHIFHTVEKTATRLYYYDDQVVTGLLQTPGYADAILSAAAGHDASPGDLAEAVSARLARSDLLTDSGQDLRIVLHEDALYRPVGSLEVMAEQIRHLEDLTTNGPAHLTLDLLPCSAPYHPAMIRSFALYETVVCVETIAGLLIFTDPTTVADYHRAHCDLIRHAVHGEEAAIVLREARTHWEGR